MTSTDDMFTIHAAIVCAINDAETSIGWSGGMTPARAFAKMRKDILFRIRASYTSKPFTHMPTYRNVSRKVLKWLAEQEQQLLVAQERDCSDKATLALYSFRRWIECSTGADAPLLEVEPAMKKSCAKMRSRMNAVAVDFLTRVLFERLVAFEQKMFADYSVAQHASESQPTSPCEELQNV